MHIVPLTTMDPGGPATALGQLCTAFGCMPVETILRTAVLSCSALVAVLVGLSYLSAARDTVAEERSRVAAEVGAFDRFADRIAEAEPEPAGQVARPSGTTVLVDPGDDGLGAVRQAYRETVMAVDHYDDDYDEPLADHMREELGPDVATAVVNGPGFTPGLQHALVDAATSAREDRRSMVRDLDGEAEALSEASDALSDARESVEGVRSEPQFAGFDALVDRWQRLGEIEAACVRAVRDRSRSVADRNAHDLVEYLYDDLPVPAPVLAEAADILDDIREERRHTSLMIGRTV